MTDIGIVLVSHSQKITDGLKELINQMAKSSGVTIVSAGGTSDGRLGTSVTKISSAIETMANKSAVLIFNDIGSSIMSSEMARDMLDDDLKAKTQIVTAPLVEGAFAAAVKASTDCSLPEILEEVESAKAQN